MIKIDFVSWEKTKKQAIFYLWPSLISSVAMLFVLPWAINYSPKLSLLTPLTSLLIFVPFVLIDVKRRNAENAREEHELQTKYDAEDKAIFGKPLRELEL